MHTKNLNQILTRPMEPNCLYSGPSRTEAIRAAGTIGSIYWTGKEWLAATSAQVRKLYPNGLAPAF